jgi:3-oxoacyl-[acyl-carrier protein] reductase
MGRLDGQVTVVTGASGGIGRAIALALAAEGATVVVNYKHSRAAAEEVAATITGRGSRALVVRADVSVSMDVARLVHDTVATFGAIDGWVNNAGADILSAETRTWPEETRWDLVMAVDLKGSWLCSRAAGELMRRQGRGAIVNMSWDQVLQGRGDPTAGIYAAAKGGVLALSRCLAREFAPEVRVNVVAPEWIRTRWAEELDGARQDAIIRETPLARLGAPDDVAAAIVFLLSAESAFITGEAILVGGGSVMA